MKSFYKGGSELPTGKGSSCPNQIESKKYKVNLPKLLLFFRLYFTSIAPVLMKYLLSTDIVLFMQLLRKQINKGKIYYKSTCRILGNYWISQGIFAAVKCLQRKAEKEAYSSGLRVLFGKSSRPRYTKVDSSSSVLRLLFDFSSRTSRSTLEALSKPSRRIVGPISNDSRRDLEALRKRSRTEVDQKLINRRRSSGVDTCLKRVWDFLIKALQESNTVCSQAVASSQLIMLESTVGSSLSYLKYTAEILSKYLKNTRELLKKYLIAAKELLYVSRFLVNLSAKIGRVVEFYTKAGGLELVDRGNDLCLKFKVFQVFYSCRVCEDGEFAIQQKSGVQNALKCSIYIFGYKRRFRLCLTCLVLVFHMFSLSAQTPRKDSGAEGLTNLMALKPGDKIPDAVWDQAFELNYFNGKKKTIKFSDLKGKLILLDFWSTGCPSCIEGIPKMELIQERFKDKLSIVLVNSKRNKDTPQRIKTRFEKYKNDFNYLPSLPTILEDTVFTTLFKHNSLPTIAIIDSSGQFVINSFSSSITEHNIQDFLKTGSAKKFVEKSEIKNINRANTQPLVDTTGLQFCSVMSGYRENYLGVYPAIQYVNGNSLFQVGNYFLNTCYQLAFPEVLRGTEFNNFVFDQRIEKDFIDLLYDFKTRKGQLWYQLYMRDRIPESLAFNYFRQALLERFKVAVERRNGSVDAYALSFDSTNALKTKSGMRTYSVDRGNQVLILQNVSVNGVVNFLRSVLDKPIVSNIDSTEKIDLELPGSFLNLSVDQKIATLRQHGIYLQVTTYNGEYPYFYPVSIQKAR